MSKPKVEETVSGLSLEVITDVIRFGCLREEWEELADTAPVTPFQTFDWSYLWWRYFGGTPDRTLHVVVFRNDDKAVCIAPLFLETDRIAGKELYRRMRFLGCDIPGSPMYKDYPLTDYLDFLVAPGWEKEAARAWVRYLEDHPGLYDEAEFVNLQSSSFLISEMVPLIAANGLGHHITRSDVCPRIVLKGSFEEYLNELDGNHRRRLRQAKRASQEEKKFVLQTAESEEEVQEAFAELVRLHQKRWNKVGSPGLFFDRRFELFQADLLNPFRERNQLWVCTAKSGDRTVAVRLCFSHRGVLYDYLSGVDDEGEESKRRPGLAVLVQAIEAACARGMKGLDLLRGGEQYKLQLSNEVRYNWNVIVINPQTVSSVRTRLMRLCRQMDRILSRMMREKIMASVFSRVYGPVGGIRRYVRSRIEAVVAKTRSSLKHMPTPVSLEEIVRRPLERARTNEPLAERILRSLQRDGAIPLQRKIFKGLVFLKSLALSPIYLRNCTTVGKRCRTRGMPHVVNDGSITIGDDFNLNSRIVRSELATGHKGRIEIGNNVRINFGALLSSQEHVRVGNNVSMGPYAIVTDSDFHSIDNPFSPPIGIPTVIEDDVWLGARVTVLKGSRIGAGSVISAGSVVAGHIPPNVIAAGNPARVIRPARITADARGPKRNGSMPPEVIERVTRVFVKTFGIEEKPDLSWGPNAIPHWDSLGHLSLVLNLESEFKTHIPEAEVAHIMTIADACHVMARTTPHTALTPQPLESGEQQ